MKRNIIVTLLGVLLVAVFALQNSEPIAIKFLLWDINITGSLALIGFLIIGAILGFLGSIQTINRKNKRIKELESDLNLNE